MARVPFAVLPTAV